MHLHSSFLCLRFCVCVLNVTSAEPSLFTGKRFDDEEAVEEEEEDEVGGVRERWRLDKEHKTNYLNKPHPFSSCALSQKLVKIGWRWNNGIAASVCKIIMHQRVEKKDEKLCLSRRKRRNRQTNEVKEEEVETHTRKGEMWLRRQMGRRWGGGGCSQMALMTNDIPCLPVSSPQHHDLSSPLLTFFIALSNHPDRMIFSNSPSLGAHQK